MILSLTVPHHVTQRGNARQVILAGDADRVVYLDLLRRYSRLHQVSLIGYCLMSNHVHLIVVPHRDRCPQTLKHTHGRYHVWQGRYYSPARSTLLTSGRRFAIPS